MGVIYSCDIITRWAHTRLVLRLLYIFRVCWLISLYMSTLITCAIIMSCTLLLCNFTLIGLTAALSTGVATVSRVAEATLMQWCEADWEWKCQKQPATHDAYRAANQLRMTARKALEWIRMFKSLHKWFLEMKYQTCSSSSSSWKCIYTGVLTPPICT